MAAQHRRSKTSHKSTAGKKPADDRPAAEIVASTDLRQLLKGLGVQAGQLASQAKGELN